MAAGADQTGVQLKADAGSYAQRLYTLMNEFLAWNQRLNDLGTSQLQALYTSVYTDPNATAEGAADLADLQALRAAIGLMIAFATATSLAGGPLNPSGQSVTDNTAGQSSVTVSVPVGAKCYVATDGDHIAQHDGVGADKGPAIRKLAPDNNF